MGKRKIFIEGNDYYSRAYFGWQDQYSALDGIKMGYKDSADCLLEETLKSGKENNIRVLDTYIFPIIFLYRHSIEISIKSIYHRFYGKFPKGGHDLIKLWDNTYKQVIAILIMKNYPFTEIDFHEIRHMLIEFNHVKDNKSDVFRYLSDKNGKLYFNESKFVDYNNLKESMNYLYKILDFIYHIIDDYLS